MMFGTSNIQKDNTVNGIVEDIFERSLWYLNALDLNLIFLQQALYGNAIPRQGFFFLSCYTIPPPPPKKNNPSLKATQM